MLESESGFKNFMDHLILVREAYIPHFKTQVPSLHVKKSVVGGGWWMGGGLLGVKSEF